MSNLQQQSNVKKQYGSNVILFPRSNSLNTGAVTQVLTKMSEKHVNESIIESLERSKDAGRFSAVLLFSISEYQILRESFGQQLGAELSLMVVSRLRDSLRKDSSHLHQISDDKFAIVLDHLESITDADLVARRLIDLCSGNYQLLEQAIHVNSAIGIALYPTDAVDANELMRYAHVALRKAKSSETSRVQFFNQELLDKQVQQVKISADLESALEQDRFVLHYQPQYSIDDNKIIGMEALIRMHTEEGELVAPDMFIPLAEESGFIVPLGNWVIREACQQLRRWRDAGCDLPRIAVNVSPIQLIDDQIIDVISEAVSEAGLCYSDLELEITEQRMVENLQSVEFLLYKLSQKGVRISVDDFGTGYSSLAYIAQLPLDVIKIDRSFMTDIPSDKRGARVVTGIIAMAKELEFEVIVEGIETKAQLEFLIEAGCKLGQGFGLARPQKSDDILKLMLS